MSSPSLSVELVTSTPTTPHHESKINGGTHLIDYPSVGYLPLLLHPTPVTVDLLSVLLRGRKNLLYLDLGGRKLVQFWDGHRRVLSANDSGVLRLQHRSADRYIG